MDSENNIIITYSFSHDKRLNKADLIPINMQIDNLIIAKWKYNTLKLKVEQKFNQKGWFKCSKDSNGVYVKISFGNPMPYSSWIDFFKNKAIFFDSGMYQGNSRNYSQWRASTSFWDSLIVESY